MATWEKVDPDTYNRLIIIKKLLRDEERLLDFLFDPLKAELRASASELLMQMGCFSSGEKIRLQVSLDIWSGEGHKQDTHLLFVTHLTHDNGVEPQGSFPPHFSHVPAFYLWKTPLKRA